MDQEHVGGTTYYYPDDAQAAEVQDEAGGPHIFPAYSVYAGAPSHLKDFMARAGASSGSSNTSGNANPVVHPNPQQNASFFAPDDIKLEIMHKNAVAL